MFAFSNLKRTPNWIPNSFFVYFFFYRLQRLFASHLQCVHSARHWESKRSVRDPMTSCIFRSSSSSVCRPENWIYFNWSRCDTVLDAIEWRYHRNHSTDHTLIYGSILIDPFLISLLLWIILCHGLVTLHSNETNSNETINTIMVSLTRHDFCARHTKGMAIQHANYVCIIIN